MKINSKDIQRIESIKQKIDDYTLANYFLEGLAQEAGMGTTKFKYLFKELYGMGIFQYIHDRRMNMAKTLLTDSDEPIKSIAGVAGFEYVSNFTAAFKKKFGLTPLQYRNKM